MSSHRALLLIILLAACGGDAEPPPAANAPAPPLPAAEAPGEEALRAVDVAVDDSVYLVEQDRARVDTATVPQPPPTIGPRSGTAAPQTPHRGEPPQLQQDAVAQDEAAAVLRGAAAAYGDVRSMRADFAMTLDNRLLRTQVTGRGTLYQQRPDRIALRFSDPAGEIILSDGQHFYVYQPGVNPGQAIRTPATTSSGGVDLQAQFVGEPTERFQYTLEGRESVGGRPAHVLNLVPRSRAEYRSLRVWIDTRDSLARRFEITEHNGSVRRFELSGLQTNVAVPESVFRFVPPQGVRIIDP